MSRLQRVDFEDTFTHLLTSDQTVPTCLNQLTKNSPAWIHLLLEWRHRLVRVFGLQTDAGSLDPNTLNFEKVRAGDRFGFVRVDEIHDQRVVFTADDKHLSFSAILEISGLNLRCTTQVQFHNIFGKIYFYTILPFHKVIVPALLKAAASSHSTL